jgi:lambda repressor-like predicted transcriptional regulator
MSLFESDWKREAIMSESRATGETLRSMTRASIAVRFGYQA